MQTLAVICERDCYPTDNDNKEKSKKNYFNRCENVGVICELYFSESRYRPQYFFLEKPQCHLLDSWQRAIFAGLRFLSIGNNFIKLLTGVDLG